ncbi:MAG: hypothetical protein ACTTHL_09650 [Oribacterium sp.]
MANITANIEGNLNIFVSGEEGSPDCMYLDWTDGGPIDHMEIQVGTPDEGDTEVLYAAPGTGASEMTLFEALQKDIKNGGLDSVEMFLERDFLAAFNSDDVVADEHGDFYLAGPLIVFKVHGCKGVSMTEEEIETVCDILKDGTTKLHNGRQVVFAYGL